MTKAIWIPWLTLSASILACAAPQKKIAPAVVPAPEKGAVKEQIQRLMDRENPAALASQPLRSADSEISATVEGSAAPQIERQEGFYSVTTPIGSDQAAQCLVFDTRRDLAAMLKTFLESLFAQSQDNIQQYTYEKPDAGVIEGHPFLGLTMPYLTKDKAYGQVKAYVIGHLDSTVLCVHDELGYPQTFRRHVTSLSRTLKLKNPKEPLETPRIHRIYAHGVDGKNFGYAEELEYENASKQRVYIELLGRMFLDKSGKLSVSDNVKRSDSDPEGRLLGARYVKAENDEQVAAVELTLEQGTRYAVKGQIRGKAVSGQFETKRGLKDEPRTRAEIARLVHGTEQSFAQEEYSYELNPLAATEMVYEKTSPTDPRKLAFKVQGLTLEATVDDRGSLLTGTLKVKDATLTFQRVFSSE